MTCKRGITLDSSAKRETIILSHDISWVNGGYLGIDLAVTFMSTFIDFGKKILI